MENRTGDRSGGKPIVRSKVPLEFRHFVAARCRDLPGLRWSVRGGVERVEALGQTGDIVGSCRREVVVL